MNLKDRKYILVIDIEATCWDDNKDKQRNEMETIEIGAVLIDSDLKQVDNKTFQSFIKPVRNEELSNFCKQLTSIKQEDVANAPLFPEVMKKFEEWIGDVKDVTFASWGAYDFNQIQKECLFHNIKFPFDNHFNIKIHFQEKQGVRTGVKKALRRLNFEFEGTPHRGIDDAKNITRILRKIGL